MPTTPHRLLLSMLAALATAACHAAPAPQTPAFQLDRVGVGALVVTVDPEPAAYRAQYLPVADWDYAEGELTHPSSAVPAVKVRADADVEAATGRRTATLNFAGLPHAGYRLTVTLYRNVPGADAEALSQETRDDVAVGAGVQTVRLGKLFQRVAAPAAVAGTTALKGMVASLPRLGMAARLSGPTDVVVDARGVAYVADAVNGGIRRVAVDAKGRWFVTTLAGIGYPGFANGAGHAARFNAPCGLALAPDGTLFVADTSNHMIRRVAIDSRGQATVTTVSGVNAAGETGAGAAASFSSPFAVAVAADGVLYVAEAARIRKLTPQANGTYLVSSFAGSTTAGYEDGGANAKFNGIRDLAVDASGVLYVADSQNHKIRRVAAVSSGGASVSTLATPTGVTFTLPTALAWDAQNRLMVGDEGRLYRYDLATGGTPGLEVLAGGAPAFADGAGTAARFNTIRGLAPTGDGGFWVSDYKNERLRRVSLVAGQWQAITRAGDGTAGNMDGPAEVVAPLGRPTGVAVTADGTIVLADAVSNRILAIDAAGSAVRVLAGTGATGRADGHGAQATFNAPDGVTVAPDGSLVVTEALNGTLRRLRFNEDGSVVVSTVTSALSYPGAAAYGPDGSLYVSEAGHPSFSFLGSHRIRKLTGADGAITLTTVAGGSNGFADGAGGVARFHRPIGLAVAADGSILVADAENHRLRKITFDAAGQATVSTLAGTGTKGKGGTTWATALFDRPTAVVIDAQGRYIVTDYWNHRLQVLSPDGGVSTLVGASGDGYSDGPAAQARFSRPMALTQDAAGAIYVVDAHPYGVRKVTP